MPVLLDLFCCEGGAATGYHAAGFDVIGVDLTEQPNHPFAFFHGDWQTGLVRYRHEVHAIHASPPCQGYTSMSNRYKGKGGIADEHPKLIADVRRALVATGLPYIIENVAGARAHLVDPVILWGGSFGLGVSRPRLFESNVPLTAPKRVLVDNPVGVYGDMNGRRLKTRKDGTEQRAASSLKQAQDAMGMPWATWRGCVEAIPPAYTEHLGRQLLQHVEGE